MKKSKKFASFCAAILLMLTMTVTTVFAAERPKEVEIYLRPDQELARAGQTRATTNGCKFWGANQSQPGVNRRVKMTARVRRDNLPFWDNRENEILFYGDTGNVGKTMWSSNPYNGAFVCWSVQLETMDGTGCSAYACAQNLD